MEGILWCKNALVNICPKDLEWMYGMYNWNLWGCSWVNILQREFLRLLPKPLYHSILHILTWRECVAIVGIFSVYKNWIVLSLGFYVRCSSTSQFFLNSVCKLNECIILLRDGAYYHIAHRVQNQLNAVLWEVVRHHALNPDLSMWFSYLSTPTESWIEVLLCYSYLWGSK